MMDGRWGRGILSKNSSLYRKSLISLQRFPYVGLHIDRCIIVKVFLSNLRIEKLENGMVFIIRCREGGFGLCE